MDSGQSISHLYSPTSLQLAMDSRHSSPSLFAPPSPQCNGIQKTRPHLPSLLDVLTNLRDQPAALAPMQVLRNHGSDHSLLHKLIDSQYSRTTDKQNGSTHQPSDVLSKTLLKKGPWTPLEDRLLLEVIQTVLPPHPAQINWVKISRLLGSRTAKQCRERYYQNLRPGLNHGPITSEEGVLIETLVEEIGHHWAEIARRLGNRSDNAVKNWWNGRQNCLRRRERREEAQSSSTHDDGARRSSIDSSCIRLPRRPQQEPAQMSLSRWGSPNLPSPTMSESVCESPRGNYAMSPRRYHHHVPFDLSTPRQPGLNRPISHDNDVIGQGPLASGSPPTSIYQLPTAPNSPAVSLMAESNANSDQQAWKAQLYDGTHPQAKKMRIALLLN